MPELPEVERARQLAERVARGRTIVAVRVVPDALVFGGLSPRSLRGALEGRRVEAVARRGKYLWLELDQTPWPVLHFGMAGQLRAPGDSPLRLSSSPRTPDLAWPPRFLRLGLEFSGGGELALADGRRLARVCLRDDPRHEPPIGRLGFDALLEVPAPRRFGEAWVPSVQR